MSTQTVTEPKTVVDYLDAMEQAEMALWKTEAIPDNRYNDAMILWEWRRDQYKRSGILANSDVVRFGASHKIHDPLKLLERMSFNLGSSYMEWEPADESERMLECIAWSRAHPMIMGYYNEEHLYYEDGVWRCPCTSRLKQKYYAESKFDCTKHCDLLKWLEEHGMFRHVYSKGVLTVPEYEADKTHKPWESAHAMAIKDIIGFEPDKGHLALLANAVEDIRRISYTDAKHRTLPAHLYEKYKSEEALAKFLKQWLSKVSPTG